MKEKVGELRVRQIKFIEEKVRELGSIDKVNEHYAKRDRVGLFGRRYGKFVYSLRK